MSTVPFKRGALTKAAAFVSFVVRMSALSIALAENAVIDFRNFIPGVLDAPVCRVDGTNRLSGSKYYVALYVSVDGGSLVQVDLPLPFGTNEWAGYWGSFDPSRPFPVVLPWAQSGQRIWIQIRAYEPSHKYVTDFRYAPRFIGYSEVFSLIVSNTPTPLIGLRPFCLQQSPVQISQRAGQVVLAWSAGDGTVAYDVEVSPNLSAPIPWRRLEMSPLLLQSGGEVRYFDWILTNRPTEPQLFYRLRLLTP